MKQAVSSSLAFSASLPSNMSAIALVTRSPMAAGQPKSLLISSIGSSLA